jgi:outer membrane protein assembly factor BamB
MAYDPNNLSALTYATGFTLWHYKTADGAPDVDRAGYFNPAAGMLRVGDYIFANASITGTVESGVFIVAANADGEVDVTGITSFGDTDSD